MRVGRMRVGGGEAHTLPSSLGGSRVSPAAPPPSRAPRERGLGRFGSKRKGERAADPYGTSLAADAANRGSVLAEVAAVSRGFLAGAAASAPPPPLRSSEGPLGPAAVSGASPRGGARALTATASQSLLGGASARARTDVGGARVLDAVPPAVRGQQSATNTAPRVSFPVHLLDKALQLQHERVSTDARAP